MKPDEVIAVLAEVFPGLVPAASGRAPCLWTFAPVAGSRARAGVRLGARWISVEAALPRDRDIDAVGGLLMQSALPGGVKVAARRKGFVVRAEIPLLVETAQQRDWLRRQAAIVYAGLRGALGAPNGVPHFSADDAIEYDPAMLAERCAAAGWHASVRHAEEVRVGFDSRFAHRFIDLSRHGNAIRAAVTLETGALAGQGPDTHFALAVFMQRATRALRWVRAFATGTGDQLEAAGFECTFVEPGDDQPVVMALGALATACELFACEAETLAESPDLAQHYLALQEDVPARPAIPAARVPADSAPAPGVVTSVAIA